MDQKVSIGNFEQKRTQGIEDPMFKKGLGYRIGQAIVDWAERLNLKYAVHGNPPVYDNATFPWAADIEKEWKLIRAELDRPKDADDIARTRRRTCRRYRRLSEPDWVMICSMLRRLWSPEQIVGRLRRKGGGARQSRDDLPLHLGGPTPRGHAVQVLTMLPEAEAKAPGKL